MNRKPPQGYWNNKKNVIDDVKKYKKRSDWRSNSPGAYQSARRNNWLDECRKHNKGFGKSGRMLSRMLRNIKRELNGIRNLLVHVILHK
jgi:hypothetical protein